MSARNPSDFLALGSRSATSESDGTGEGGSTLASVLPGFAMADNTLETFGDEVAEWGTEGTCIG